MDGKTQMELLTQFHSTIGRMLRQIHDTQSGVICRAGIAICEAVRAGGSFFATGTGHSHMLAEELYTRAGGLALSLIHI